MMYYWNTSKLRTGLNTEKFKIFSFQGWTWDEELTRNNKGESLVLGPFSGPLKTS